MRAPLLKMAILAALAGVTAGAPLQGQEPEQTAGAGEDLTFATDRTERMTVPVSIGGRGPYNFLVDTGAERTLISRELARELSLGTGRTVMLQSMSEADHAGTVVIPRLDVSRKTVRDINAPALSRSHLGAEGMLDLDSLQSQRVLFDFERQRMTVSPSRRREAYVEPDMIVVRARSRLGRLILADARLDGQKVWVIVDTGAQISVGNEALRRKLMRKGRLGATAPIEMTSVTGGTVKADLAMAGGLEIGRVTLKGLPIAFADVHPFRKLDLLDRPALLLGMNALRVFDSVSIDFANRTVQFNLPDVSGRQPATRMAALAR